MSPALQGGHPLLEGTLPRRTALWAELVLCAGIDCRVYILRHSLARQLRCAPVGVCRWAEVVAAGSPVLPTTSAMVPGLQIGLCMHPAQVHPGVLHARWGDQTQAVALGTIAAGMVALGGTEERAQRLAPQLAAQLRILPPGLDFAAVTQRLEIASGVSQRMRMCSGVAVYSAGTGATQPPDPFAMSPPPLPSAGGGGGGGGGGALNYRWYHSEWAKAKPEAYRVNQAAAGERCALPLP